jgi:branched-chain amino acid transport system ATP-binding protein
LVLRVDDLHVSYGRVPAVRGISVNVDAGEIVSLVGPNGAGKSTALLAIAGVLTPVRGTILLDGVSTVGASPEDIARRGLSLVPEGRHVFTQLTVEENVRLGTQMRSDRGEVERDFERLLGEFSFLRKRLASPAGKLSGGEQQQLVIARALMTRPQLMLLDEPALGLAPLVVETVYRILRSLRDKGLTLLIVEQSTHRALENADRIYVVRSGRIELHGRSAELGNRDVQEAYFGHGKAAAD